jgi:hypothetical protein
MSEKTLKMRIQNRHSTGVEWETVNPLLLDGEIAVVRINGETRLKIGDGVTYYNDLPFIDDPLRDSLSGELTIDLTGEISEVFKDGSWSKTDIVDANNANVAMYVTRISLSNIGKENKNPDVILRDINGFEYKGDKRIEADNIYFYSNTVLPGCLVADFGSSETTVNIVSEISETLTIGSWSLTEVVDPANSNIAKYITKISLASTNSKKRLPDIFIKDENNFIVEALKRVGFDYAYIYSNEAVSGKIIALF